MKASTRSENRFSEINAVNASPFILDIENISEEELVFLQSEILVINITSKNIDNYLALIKKIERSGIKKLIFISSTSVYENNNKIISESDGYETSTKPLFIIENLFRKSNQFETTIVRFGGLIGYRRNPGNFFRKGKLVQYPEAPVNLIHRDDCINIIGHIVQQGIWGEVFNCCADTHPTKREFYTQATTKIGLPVPEFITSEKNSFKIISNKKVKSILKYDFVHDDLMKIKV